MNAERTWTKEQIDAARLIWRTGVISRPQEWIGRPFDQEDDVAAEIAKHAHRFVSYGFMVDERDAARAEADALKAHLKDAQFRSEALIGRAKLEEREACAKIADGVHSALPLAGISHDLERWDGINDASKTVAARIRSRSAPPEPLKCHRCGKDIDPTRLFLRDDAGRGPSHFDYDDCHAQPPSGAQAGEPEWAPAMIGGFGFDGLHMTTKDGVRHPWMTEARVRDLAANAVDHRMPELYERFAKIEAKLLEHDTDLDDAEGDIDTINTRLGAIGDVLNFADPANVRDEFAKLGAAMEWGRKFEASAIRNTDGGGGSALTATTADTVEASSPSVPPSASSSLVGHPLPGLPSREEIARKLFCACSTQREAPSNWIPEALWPREADAVLALLAERDEAWGKRVATPTTRAVAGTSMVCNDCGCRWKRHADGTFSLYDKRDLPCARCDNSPRPSLRYEDTVEAYTRGCRERDALQARVAELERDKKGAYVERDRLVCALSKIFPSWIARHPDSDTKWDDDWRWIVFVSLPTGQATWHIHDSERQWFAHLPEGANLWDGHTTEEKYRRLAALHFRPAPAPSAISDEELALALDQEVDKWCGKPTQSRIIPGFEGMRMTQARRAKALLGGEKRGVTLEILCAAAQDVFGESNRWHEHADAPSLVAALNRRLGFTPAGDAKPEPAR